MIVLSYRSVHSEAASDRAVVEVMRKCISDLWMLVHGPSASESLRELTKNHKYQGPNPKVLIQ